MDRERERERDSFFVVKLQFPLPSCRDFSWSPGDNVIAYWVPEDKDIPARVTLSQMPTREEIRVRNLFNVVDCKLHWQRNGDYLCVKVDRTPKGTPVRKNEAGPTRPSSRSTSLDVHVKMSLLYHVYILIVTHGCLFPFRAWSPTLKSSACVRSRCPSTWWR